MDSAQTERASLREAIAQALHLADAQHETLIAALLADALAAADQAAVA